jgi:hypothetical protein
MTSSQSWFYDQVGVEGINRESHHLITNTIRVGSFEIPQDEQAFLTDVLIARALSKIRWTHESMMDYIKRVHETPFATIGPVEKRPIHFVLEDLHKLVLATEVAIRTIIHS